MIKSSAASNFVVFVGDVFVVTAEAAAIATCYGGCVARLCELDEVFVCSAVVTDEDISSGAMWISLIGRKGIIEWLSNDNLVLRSMALIRS